MDLAGAVDGAGGLGGVRLRECETGSEPVEALLEYGTYVGAGGCERGSWLATSSEEAWGGRRTRGPVLGEDGSSHCSC